MNAYKSWERFRVPWFYFKGFVEKIVCEFFLHAISHWIQVFKEPLK